MTAGLHTDDLIETLAADAGRANGPGLNATLALVVAGTAVYALAVIAVVAGVRADFLPQIGWVAAKAGLSLGFTVVGLPLLMRAARPGRRAGWWTAAAIAAFVLAGATACGAVIAAEPADRSLWLSEVGFPHILLVIPLVAIPAAGTLFMWMRRQAPTQPAQAGGAIGLVAGSVVAAGYALSCPVDGTAFVCAAYSLAIGICAAAGALAGRYLLRW